METSTQMASEQSKPEHFPHGAGRAPVVTPLGPLPWRGSPPPVLSLRPERRDAAAGDKRASSLSAVFDRFGIDDGQVLSFHHHYRNGDRLIGAVVAEARRRGLRGLTLLPSSLFPVHAPLVEALRDGTVSRIVTDYMRGPVADAVAGRALADPVLLQTHGGRARAISSGQIGIDAAFVAAPLARPDGAATGRGGALACGPLGYPAVDCRFARQTVVAAHDIVSAPLPHEDIPAHCVDAVLHFPDPGDVAGILSGSTVPADTPTARRVATLLADSIAAVGHLRNGLSLQSGAGGFSLAAVPEIGRRMAARGVRGAFLSGGIASAHVDLLESGLFERIHDVQCFDLRAVRSAIANPAHRMMSAIEYASPLNPDAIANRLSIMLLGAVEIDTGFNVNVVVGANGEILGGPGGHPDTASGAALSIVTTALTGGGYPKVVPRVRAIVTEGADVDILVTDRGIAVNPARPELAADLRTAGLPVVSIDDLCRLATELAGRGVPLPPDETDLPRFLIEHRSGTLLAAI